MFVVGVKSIILEAQHNSYYIFIKFTFITL